MATTLPTGRLNELTNGTTRREFNTKETAILIRAALKAAFPGQKFSVTTSYASMTSSTSIRWTDGPTQPEVELITDRFTSRGFDGMTDSTTYHSQELNGEPVTYSGWVHVRRDLSPALLEKALSRFQVMRSEYGLPAANVAVQAGHFPHVDGPDMNAEAGVNPCGFRYAFRCVSDAVQSVAHHLRPNGCLVFVKVGAR
jgi:hypothetical protein